MQLKIIALVHWVINNEKNVTLNCRVIIS